ncbi:MAG: glycosyltransferase [Devosia sp.]|uniref:glycosyltransferase n=1 Tax=Devosia sp. TaxID=1871048 RepID=UPI0026398B1D|nr:glycosyltransferase [Devosia sp.]MDB5530998.1 glycosyltransferase [Devosia sp.]
MAKLIFHVPSLIGGGAERVWVLVANEMARRGHDTTLLVWNGLGPNRVHVSPDVHLVDFGIALFGGERFGKPATLRGLLRMAAFFRRHQPDAVFSAPEFANLTTALALWLSASRAKFFPSFHAAAILRDSRTGSELARRFSGLMARRATRAIAVSQGIAGDLSHGIAADKIAVIHNPLPPPSLKPVEDSEWMGGLTAVRAANIPIIITAGRLAPVKDHRTLIEAFALLRRDMPAKLVILGDGPLRGELTALVAERGLEADVLLPGFVADIRPSLSAADLFVLTSTSEGFGNVIVEAMAVGLPVVSTDCPHGPREILENGALGELAPVGDAGAIAAAMSRMLANPTSANRLQTRAADFSVERIGDQYEALLTL